MTYLKIEKIDTYDWLDKKIKYNLREEKREGINELVTHLNCYKGTELQQFKLVHLGNYRKKYLAREFIQSFKIGDINAELAHKISVEFAEQFLGKFQVIISTHVDKEHIHSHILFNNVSIIDNTCFYDSKNMLIEARKISDEICKKYNVSIINNKDLFRGDRTTEEKLESVKKKKTFNIRDNLKEIIDTTIKENIGSSFETLIKKLSEKDVNIITHSNNGTKLKHIKVFHKNSRRAIRLSSLGEVYSENNIKNILKNGNVELLNVKRKKSKRERQYFVEKTVRNERYNFTFKTDTKIEKFDNELKSILKDYKTNNDPRAIKKMYINKNKGKDYIHNYHINEHNFDVSMRARNIIEDIGDKYFIHYINDNRITYSKDINSNIYEGTKNLYYKENQHKMLLEKIDTHIDKEINNYIELKEKYKNAKFPKKLFIKINIRKKIKDISKINQTKNDFNKSLKILKDYIKLKEQQYNYEHKK